MLSAYVLMDAEVGRARQVIEAVRNVNGVLHADSVAGPFDIIVRVDAEDIDALGRILVRDLQTVDGVTRTLTCTVIKR